MTSFAGESERRLARRSSLSAAAVACVLAAGACSEDDRGVPAADAGETDEPDAGEGPESDAAPPVVHGAAAWYFTTDPGQNEWHTAIVDPEDPEEITVLEIGDLADLSGPSGNDRGPSWGDALASSDGSRIFANASSVDRVAVFDTVDRSFETLLSVGERPLHMYKPHQGGEMWTHSDGEGAFYVIDQGILTVSDPLVKSLEGTGHGKLIYAEELGAEYYATNTNDPGGWFIDATGDGDPEVELIELCHVPCEDGGGGDHEHSHGGAAPAHDGESCGGTHDGGYNPATQYAIFECAGDTSGHYAFVDTTTNDVVIDEGDEPDPELHHDEENGDDLSERADLFAIRGALAASPGNEYILVIDTGADEDQIQIWDTSAPEHDGIAFDATATVGDQPSPRGTRFWQHGDGDWEAWIPQTGGEHVAVLNLTTLDLDLVDIGPVSPPPGAAFFSRRGAVGGGYFWTHNDDGAVFVDLETRDVIQGPALPGAASRMTFADPESD